MAMAAVRFAARRLTGQQPRAFLGSVVEDQHGLLSRGGSALRRFTSSSDASAANGSRIKAEQPPVSGDSRLMAADRKKEELCDLLHEIQMNKDIPRARRMKDRWLLQRLTEHVDPRPNNPEWRWYLREHAANRFLGGTMILLSSLFVVELYNRNKQVQGAYSGKVSVSTAEPNIEE